MRLMPIRVAASLMAVLSAASACGDPLAPGRVAGTYALQRVEGDPLPTVIFANEYVRIRILADTIRLNEDGTGSEIRVDESEPLQGGSRLSSPTRGESTFRFETDGGRIEIAYTCAPNANCIAPPHLVGRPVSLGLRFDFALGQRVPLLYTRVAVSD